MIKSNPYSQIKISTRPPIERLMPLVDELQIREATDTQPMQIGGRCVPYGAVTQVWDPVKSRMINECFDHGAFTDQVRASRAHTVLFRITHQEAFTNQVGYGVELEERDDGLHAWFRLWEADAQKAREMIDTAFNGLSVGFRPLHTERRGDVVHRVRAHLDHVAAVMEGTAAYPDAMVLAMRDTGDGSNLERMHFEPDDFPPDPAPVPVIDTALWDATRQAVERADAARARADARLNRS